MLFSVSTAQEAAMATYSPPTTPAITRKVSKVLIQFVYLGVVLVLDLDLVVYMNCIL